MGHVASRLRSVSRVSQPGPSTALAWFSALSALRTFRCSLLLLGRWHIRCLPSDPVVHLVFPLARSVALPFFERLRRLQSALHCYWALRLTVLRNIKELQPTRSGLNATFGGEEALRNSGNLLSKREKFCHCPDWLPNSGQ